MLAYLALTCNVLSFNAMHIGFQCSTCKTIKLTMSNYDINSLGLWCQFGMDWRSKSSSDRRWAQAGSCIPTPSYREFKLRRSPLQSLNSLYYGVGIQLPACAHLRSLLQVTPLSFPTFDNDECLRVYTCVFGLCLSQAQVESKLRTSG